MSELLAAAIGYLERGWAVLPVAPRGKVPLTRHGLKDATTDRDQVERWWRRAPQANIGVATGPPSGLLVVDLDGEEGLGSWARLEARHGVTLTLEAATGGGGVHLVYGYPAGVGLGNSAGRLGGGVDTRGRGGYIIAPPSVHPSGRRYTWTVRGAASPAPAPGWLVDLLRPRAPRAEPSSPPIAPGPRARGYWQTAVEQELRQLAELGGHDALTRAAYRLGRLAHLGIPEEPVIEALADAALVNARPDSAHSRAAALKTAGECFAAGKSQPRHPERR